MGEHAGKRRVLPLVSVAFIVLIAIAALASGVNFIWLTEIVRQSVRTTSLQRDLLEGQRRVDAARLRTDLDPEFLASRQASLAAASAEVARLISSTSRHSVRAMASVAVSSFGIILTGIALMVLVSRRIAHPLRLLLEANERVARGELASRVAYQASDEMGALADSFNRMARGLQRSVEELLRQKKTLEQRVAEATAGYRALSLTDDLTGLPNLRHLRDVFHDAVAEARRSGQPFALAIVDAASLRRLNERFGREAGDLLLVAAGRCLRAAARETDFVARYGGGTFAVLIPGAEGLPELFLRRLDAQRLAVQTTVSRRTHKDVPIRLKLGVASFPADGETLFALVAAADRAASARDDSPPTEQAVPAAAAISRKESD